MNDVRPILNTAHPTVRGMLRELMRGKSILSSAVNLRLKGISLKGPVVDLGSRNRSPSYYRYLNVEESEIRFCDYYSESPGVERVDLEGPLPFQSRAFNYSLLFHVLEHIYDTRNLLSEMCRITAFQAIIVVPFAAPPHPDPHDFHRFTEEALDRAAREAGFESVKIYPVGEGALTYITFLLHYMIKSRGLRCITYIFSHYADAAIARIFPNKQINKRFPLAYICIGSHSDGHE